MVIVESPAKAKTIGRYLGSEYAVKACMGHVRDLPTSDLGIDLDNDFRPTYQTLTSKRKVVSALKKAAGGRTAVYLATDLDREGEAIAWHLVHELDLNPQVVKRVVFNEITQSAIREAFDHPQDLDMGKVDAQQARRLLDRIVGYQLSPLLWKKVAKGLSAGRVQSVAVRLIVERESEIRAFIPQESWRICGCFATDPSKAEALSQKWCEFLADGDGEADRTVKERNRWLSEHRCLYAQLVRIGDAPFSAKTASDARAVAELLGFRCDETREEDWKEYAEQGLKQVSLVGRTDREAAPPYSIKDIQTKRTKSRPSPPFITATMQQSASVQLGFGAQRTMRIAQQLYEGVELGGSKGPFGLITYMRTDSTSLSKESVGKARDLIKDQYGERYLPGRPNTYGSAKRAQQAHEAIRPTDSSITPESIRNSLTGEQFKLYDLIWRRFIACQMTPAEWDGTTALISAETPRGQAVFKASGRRLIFDGFYRVMGVPAQDDVVLPEMKVEAPAALLQIDPKQQYTSPPPRYTEAALIKELEADGIGRPSTYAAIIQTIQDRGYVELLDKRFFATDKGQIVTEKLVESFPKIMDVKFTSYMENELDKIEDEHLDWVSVLREFYEPFKESLDRAQTDMEPARSERSQYKCPRCERPMVYRWARTGRFLSCTGYPDCTGAYNIDRDGKPVIPKVSEVVCEECGRPMLLRQSRRGPFLGCSGYPECSNTIPCDAAGTPLRLVTEAELERPCEQCGGGTMKVKRKGTRAFLGCDAYPKCKATAPLPQDVRLERKVEPVELAGFNCDKCGRAMVIRRGRRGKFIACSGFPRCRNTKSHEKLDEFLRQVEEGTLEKTDPQAAEAVKNGNGNAKTNSLKKIKEVPRTPDGKVDYEAMGPPPEGFAWTRTGKPVVETWPEGTLHCPQCGSEMVCRRGRFGPFFSCTAFPKCRCSVNLRGEAKKRGKIEFPPPQRPEPIPTDIVCEECGTNKMVIRVGRAGKFLACAGYPKCKATKPLPEGVDEKEPASTGS